MMIIVETLIEKGEEVGFAKGKKHGLRKERQQVALKLLRAGIGTSFITQITGLTPQEIQALQDDANLTG